MSLLEARSEPVATRPSLDAQGLHIVDEQIIRDEYVCPYQGFLDELDD